MDDETFPFLFIDEGAATLSGSATGVAIVRDTVTQREIQRLEHSGIYCLLFSVVFSEVRVSSRRSPDFYDGTSRLGSAGG